MEIILCPQDKWFRRNLREVRNATLSHDPAQMKPKFLVVHRGDQAFVGDHATVFLGDTQDAPQQFEYHWKHNGIQRCLLSEINEVRVFF